MNQDAHKLDLSRRDDKTITTAKQIPEPQDREEKTPYKQHQGHQQGNRSSTLWSRS
jgi:hypothetical protein